MRKSGSKRGATGRNEIAAALRARILGGLHVGRLAGGDRLPSARALASEFGVNERVVLAALRTLADEGFIDLRRRSGAYVTPVHPASEPGLPDLSAWVVRMLVDVRTRGVAPRQISNYLRRTLETRRVRAACIECNRDQLHLLCSELADDYGFETEGTEIGEMRRSSAIANADVLVTTLYHAAEVQAAAKSLGKACVAVTLRPDVMAMLGASLRQGPLYYVATDPRYEKKLSSMLEGLGPVKNLRVIVLGRDDLDSIPADAPTYVMTSAREQLRARYGASGGPGHPIHPARIFSDQSAKELLTLLVRANNTALAAGIS